MYLELNDIEAERIGRRLIECLNLKKKRSGMYYTDHGDKYPQGVARVVADIIMGDAP